MMTHDCVQVDGLLQWKKEDQGLILALASAISKINKSFQESFLLPDRVTSNKILILDLFT